MVTSTTSTAKRPPGRIDRLLARCSRVTSSGAFIAEVDGLRFFAIMAVVLFHLNGYIQGKHAGLTGLARDSLLNQMLSTGSFGVELFFVISGFILATPFATQFLHKNERKISLKSYYLRRVTRLEPPYFINLFIMVGLHLFIFRHYSTHRIFCHLLPSLFYIHNIIYGCPSLINIPAWSLEIEVQFYILAPLISQLFRIKSRASRLLSFIILPVLAASFGRFYGLPTKLNILGTLAYFITGFVLADIFIVSWKQKPGKSWSWDILGTLAWVGIICGLMWMWKPRTIIMPVFILIAYIGAFRGVIWNKIVRNRWLVTVGGMCYTIYLYHDPLISFFAKATLSLANLAHNYILIIGLQIAVLIPLVVGASALLFIIFEKPFMYRDWPSKWSAMVRKK